MKSGKVQTLFMTAIWFLDGVMEEFIQRAKGLRGFENAVRSATKGRALGAWSTWLAHVFTRKKYTVRRFTCSV